MDIRIAGVDAAAAIASIYAPYVRDTIVSFETQAPDSDEIARRIARIGVQYPWLTAIVDDRVVGYAYACEHRARLAYRWSVDVAVYLESAAHGRGIGRALYRTLLALLREQRYVNAFGGITLPNEASVGLHEAMGFVPIGVYRRVGFKLGAWRDVGWWQLALGEARDDAPEPVAFVELDAGRVEEMIRAGRPVG